MRWLLLFRELSQHARGKWSACPMRGHTRHGWRV